MTVDVLAISGPGGVGKSAAAFEASLILRRHGVAHAVIDTDELDRLYPVPDDLPAFAEGNLAALWRRFAERGVQRLILVGVVLDRPDEADRVRRAVPGAAVTHVRLMASAEVLAGRVHEREIGSGLAGQLERTQRRLNALRRDNRPEVQTIDTDALTVPDVAERALAITGWLP